ncbi:SH3 domain-containing protein [Myxacorys almedinensis]|uniref:SH3 domain-containing protein n=1 Tax=Myxacorys almedinensis A TaxID=2690445 RepID=A0A8J7Z258_9CYAN|nr:SH3 domain-containing protein [Myxacorys almedinensis]NDJ18659.1 SH3 domain-containing protein [Myxacorys almedinensis A]
MSWSGLSKLLMGLLLAIAMIAGGGFIAARIMIARLAAPPPKPIYPNDKPIAATPAPTAAKVEQSEVPPTTPAATAKPLPSGATEARVTQPIGLILRDSPDGEQIGGIEYNERVIVLETSQDGSWQKVRLRSSDKEGWVKAGNVQ